MQLFGKDLSKDVVIIAEIGVNHEGDLEKAKEMISLAAEAGADAVKFQSYTPERFISSDDADRLARVGRFSLSEKDHYELVDIAKSKDIHFFSSAVSEDWVPFLAEISETIKIASADITFEPVIRAAAASGKVVILSTGGSTIDEVDTAVSWVREEVGGNLLSERLVLLHCISSYPTPMEEANLLSIPYLQERYPDVIVGYSNHAKEREVNVSAVALGARVLEVHFTYRKENQDFHDHALSADPDDMAYYAEMLPRIAQMRGVYDKQPQACEREMVPVIRKGLIAATDLPIGHILKNEDIHYARPSTGFPASAKPEVVGRQLDIAVKAGQVLKPEMLKG
ncbi:N-acetylneuraminate synthase family protein [Curvivirga sp.]|uniref:N-acetylneuraminate synthase family protein n=1 Tax=Curvivirga sp. TaxID=2856848 RepID=UPI003B596CD2